jgi:hypothetical protein
VIWVESVVALFERCRNGFAQVSHFVACMFFASLFFVLCLTVPFFSDDQAVEFQQHNPKRAGTGAYERYEVGRDSIGERSTV